MEEIRNNLKTILMGEEYGILSLAKAIGISHPALLRFMKNKCVPSLRTQLRIRKFMEIYDSRRDAASTE